MKLNRRMQGYLEELRSRNVDAAPMVPGKWPDLSMQQIGDIVLLDSFCKKPCLRPSDFGAASALECCANKVLVERMLDPYLVYVCPLLLLTGGLFIAEQVSKRLIDLPGRFNVIVSYDGESCAVRFHKIREGESWLCDDLESYVDEGILVVEAGADPVLRLTGN